MSKYLLRRKVAEGIAQAKLKKSGLEIGRAHV